MYEEQELNQQQIADYYGVDRGTIDNRIREYEIKKRTMSESKTIPNAAYRKHHVKVDFFDTWSPETAWVYGWILGDGYVGDRSIFIGLARRDKDVLFKIQEILCSDHPVEDYVGNGFINSDMSKIRIHSKSLSDSFRKIRYTDIPEVYFSDFLRGFFEAEGNISSSTSF